MRRCLFILAVVFLLILPSPVAYAQTASPDATPLPALSDLKDQYRKSLDDERAKEDQFSIASQQYYTLQTLAAESDAVRAAREVDLARVDTLLIYLQTLHTTLDTNLGIELSRKTTLEQQLDLLVDTLKRHRARVEIATNRIQIEQENVFLANQEATIEGLCYEALALIKIGAVQAALDQLVLTQQSVNDYIASAPISETTRTDKQRGSDEVSRSIDTIKQILSDAMNTYDSNIQHSDSTLLTQVQGVLGPAYANLTQSLEFIKELSQ